MVHDVFISYSKDDRIIATAISHILEQEKIRCWIAPRDVTPGSSYAEEIVNAISTTKIVLLIFSNNSNYSIHVKREIENAVSKGVPIIPFRIEDIKLSAEMEYFIGSTHWLDAIPPPIEQYFTLLIQIIKSLLSSIKSNSESINKTNTTQVEEQTTLIDYSIDLEVDSDIRLKRLIKLFRERNIFDSTRDKLYLLVDRINSNPEFNIVYDYEQDFVSSLDKRNYTEAKNCIDHALNELELMVPNVDPINKNRFNSDKSRLLIRKGMMFRAMGGANIHFFKDSIECFREAVNNIDKIEVIEDQEIYKIIAFIGLIDIHRVMGDLTTSMKYCDRISSNVRKMERKTIDRKKMLCLGYFYNQLGLVELEKWFANSSIPEYLVNSQDSQVISLTYFLRLRQIKWIYKTTIDLFGTIYNKKPNRTEIDDIVEIIEIFQMNSQFIAFQQTHNFLLAKAKMLTLRGDKQSLELAKKSVLQALKRSEQQKQLRTFSTESIGLGIIQLLTNEMGNGLESIRIGLENAKNYKQIKKHIRNQLLNSVKQIREMSVYAEENIIEIEKEIFLYLQDFFEEDTSV